MNQHVVVDLAIVVGRDDVLPEGGVGQRAGLGRGQRLQQLVELGLLRI